MQNANPLMYAYVQGYPQRMRLQLRLYGIYTVYFRIYDALQLQPCFFHANSLNKPLKDYISDRGFNSTLGSSDF